jgi:hypothetical protein
MESSLVDHLALETYLLKDQADFSENAFFKMDEYVFPDKINFQTQCPRYHS